MISPCDGKEMSGQIYLLRFIHPTLLDFFFSFDVNQIANKKTVVFSSIIDELFPSQLLPNNKNYLEKQLSNAFL